MQRLTHHRAKAGSILPTTRSEHRATQPTVPRLSSCACACGKCIPYTQKTFVRRGCSRVLQVGCYFWFQLRSFTCPIHVLLAATAAVTSPGCLKYHAHGTLFVVPFLVLLGPGACCNRCTAPPRRDHKEGSGRRLHTIQPLVSAKREVSSGLCLCPSFPSRKALSAAVSCYLTMAYGDMRAA